MALKDMAKTTYKDQQRWVLMSPATKSVQNIWQQKPLIRWTEKTIGTFCLPVVHTVNCCHTDVVESQLTKCPQEHCTSGSVDSTAGLAATARWWIPWCFELLVQTGLISIWVTAVIVAIVSLSTLCRTTFWSLYIDKACRTMKSPLTRRGSKKSKN